MSNGEEYKKLRELLKIAREWVGARHLQEEIDAALAPSPSPSAVEAAEVVGIERGAHTRITELMQDFRRRAPFGHHEPGSSRMSHRTLILHSNDIERLLDALLDAAIVTDKAERLLASPPPASPSAPQRVEVKPLVWRKPDDHPKDPDPDDCLLAADGIGGVYAISKRQNVGPAYLLWWAHDPMDWSGFARIDEAKAAAFADYRARILSAIQTSPEAGR